MAPVKDLGKQSVLGVQVDAVDYEAARSRVLQAARRGVAYSVTALAVHGVATAHLDRSLLTRLNGFDLVVPDGQPVRWALNLLHSVGLDDRVYGPELMSQLLRDCEQLGLPTYFYGSSEGVMAALLCRIRARYPRLLVAGATPSLFRTVDSAELTEIASRIEASGARLVFVGLGCPRQELFVHAIRRYLPRPCIAVGAAFDFHAGLLSQAPGWMQRRGLEWLWRLAAEPRRLWRRYLLLNPYFVSMLVRQKLVGLPAPAPMEAPERHTPIPA